MRKIYLNGGSLLIFLLFSFTMSSQTFSGAGGLDLPDSNCDATNQQTVTVSGIGVMTTTSLTNVTLDIFHPFTGDLDISLISPTGTAVDLSSDNGSSGDNYTNTQFEDNGVDGPITAGTPPFTGIYIPEQPLSTFCGENADGDWILQACDDGSGDTGTLLSWSITFGSSTACSCTAPTATAAAVSNCPTPTYDITVDLTDVGSATTVDITESTGTDSELGVVAGMYTLTGIPAGSGAVDVTIADAADPTCSVLLTVQVPNCPPANDLCADATSIAIGGVLNGTNISAGNVGDPGTCAAGGGAPGSAQVWFVVTSNAAETITAELCSATDTDFDTKMYAYSGSCGALVCEAGNDDSCENTTTATRASSISWVSPLNFAPIDYYILVTGFNAAEGNFLLSVSAAPLPIELMSFEGTSMENGNKLTWSTSTELNTEFHVIERSVNGENGWDEIGRVAAAGESFETMQYTFMDEKPLAKGYYRLVTVDLDKSEQLSDVLSLEREEAGFTIATAFPNPTSEYVNVQYHSPKNVSVEVTVTDLSGKIVQIYEVDANNGMNNLEVNMTELASGTYFLSLSNSIDKVVERLIKH